MQKSDLIQVIKYGIVGVFNTAICLGTIFVFKSIFGFNIYVSNVAGYTAGLINSFIWNRKWVFQSAGKPMNEALRFLAGWAVCYCFQLFCMWLMLSFTPLSTWQLTIPAMQSVLGLPIATPLYHFSGEGMATLIGAVIYTAVNYTYNRIVVFGASKHHSVAAESL